MVVEAVQVETVVQEEPLEEEQISEYLSSSLKAYQPAEAAKLALRKAVGVREQHL